jgi:hypothetical protein
MIISVSKQYTQSEIYVKLCFQESSLFAMASQNHILFRQRRETNVSQNSRRKPCTKPERGLVSTPSKRALDGKEVIRVVEYDHKIRELIVPSLEPTVYPALLDINEFNRIKQQAKVNIKVKDLCKLYDHI